MIKPYGQRDFILTDQAIHLPFEYIYVSIIHITQIWNIIFFLQIIIYHTVVVSFFQL